MPAPLRTRRGLGRAFQLTQLFPNLTVEENLRTGFAALPRGQRAIPEEVLDLFPVPTVAVHTLARITGALCPLSWEAAFILWESSNPPRARFVAGSAQSNRPAPLRSPAKEAALEGEVDRDV